MTLDAAKIRDRAKRILELAIKARSADRLDEADELAKVASEALAHADAMERRYLSQQGQSYGRRASDK